jgi:beta-1,4-N-acetylglucosaminyltransferase
MESSVKGKGWLVLVFDFLAIFFFFFFFSFFFFLLFLADELSGGSTLRCFVTVGTTKFEALIAAVDSSEVLDALEARGYSEVVVQFGAGEHEPFAKKRKNMTLEAYRFKPSLQDDMKRASLVITHAGYGCLMESLTLQKNVIAVINETLMDNHQVEIGRELASKRHAVMCTPQTLADVIRKTDFKDRVPLPAANPQGYVKLIGELMGVSE